MTITSAIDYDFTNRTELSQSTYSSLNPHSITAGLCLEKVKVKTYYNSASCSRTVFTCFIWFSQ
jgi:hypothetical protein